MQTGMQIRWGIPLVVLAPLWGTSAAAQSITAAVDGTHTVVTQQDSQFTIEQGTLSANGANLFHSFESFAVGTGEQANFVVPADVQNVLARVSSAAPALINGHLQVSGGAPNFYLMNPAGVLIGPDASVNLPANLTVTTADGIGFGENWFRASGENSYENLTSEPAGDYVFSAERAGAIANEANLSLKPAASLTLLGGTVVNTGHLSTAGGEVTVAAVPGESLVRLRSNHSLLTLELSAVPASFERDMSAIVPLDLPALLTHSEQTHASNLVVNADGTVSLTGSSLAPVLGGSSAISRGQAIVSGGISVDYTVDSSLPAIGGNITVVGDRISLLNASLSAAGLQGGGTLRIGGDYRGQSTLPAATLTTVDAQTTLVANALIHGDGGQVTIWANDTTQYLGEIVATGGERAGNGGRVEVSGKQSLFFNGNVDTRAPFGEIGSLLLDPENIVIVNGAIAPDDAQVTDAEILAGEMSDRLVLSERTLARLAGSTALTLEANNNITVEPLMDKTLAFRPGTGAITLRADADNNGIGDFIMSEADTTLIAPGRNVSISGANLRLGDLNTAALFQAGNIDLLASGSVTTGNIATHTSQSGSQSGHVTITAADITTRNILTQSPTQSGNVSLFGQVGSITAGVISTGSTNGTAGSITLSAPIGITVGGEIIQSPPVVPSSPPVVPSPPPIPTQPPDSPEISRLLLDQLGALAGGFSSSSSSSMGAASDASSSSNSGAGYASQTTVLSNAEATMALAQLEGEQGQNFSTYFGRQLTLTARTLEEIQQLLADIAQASGNRTAIIYAQKPESIASQSEIVEGDQLESTTEKALELLLIMADSPAVKIEIPELTTSELTETISRFRADLLTSVRRGGTPYLASAQTLYQWLVAPVEAAIAESGAAIDTLAFAMDTGLRTIPIAALHDGEQFLIEKYSVGVLPALGLVDTQYSSLNEADVMVMGASQFDQLEPLPAVPLEVEQIHQLWPGAAFLNEQFTRDNLIQQRAQNPYRVIHLATHAEFSAGSLNSSYIQLWDEPLRLDELQQLGWQNPPVDLLVLSACSTAVGSPEAEMGFAGLAVASGVRSAMASLWSVDDLGTLALMREFYRQLRTTSTKVEALQAAQLAMLNGNIQMASGQLWNDALENALSLPPSLGTLSEINFSHPYYWSGFTMIGSPW
jgi:filamentous hemagglutinin family protein